MKNVPVSAILSIVVGVIVLLVPNLISYVIGIYLIVVGILSVTKR